MLAARLLVAASSLGSCSNIPQKYIATEAKKWPIHSSPPNKFFFSLVKSYAPQMATKEKPTGVEEMDMAAEAAKAAREPAKGEEERMPSRGGHFGRWGRWLAPPQRVQRIEKKSFLYENV